MLRAWAETIESISSQVVMAQLVRALEAGDISGAIELLGLEPAAFEPYAQAIEAAYRQGGTVTAMELGRMPTPTGSVMMRFNVRSPAAEAWLAVHSSQRIVEVADETKALARLVLTEGLAQGRNPRNVALDLVGRVDQRGQRIGGFIGLTEQQGQWVKAAREELESGSVAYLERKLRDPRFDKKITPYLLRGEPPPVSLIDSAVTNYQARAQRFRGENIARTEAINSLRAGQAEAVTQAIDEYKGEATKTWDSTGADGRTRDSHLDHDGQTVPVDQPFNLDGELLMFPGDDSLGASAGNLINCRCRADYRISFGKVIKRLEGL